MGPRRAHSFVHLHMVSDATGETLLTVARAAAARYVGVRALEHFHALIRSRKQLEAAISEIEEAPGLVLYTMVDEALSKRLEEACAALGCPCVSILDPVLHVFQSYLGAEQTARIGAQHVLDSAYFRRIDALNFTMLHDDGQLAEEIDEADIVLVGISRTSKTPTSIYLANRGYKTANIPFVPGIPLPPALETARRPLIVGLTATPERIRVIRQNRLLSLNGDGRDSYVDRAAIASEVAESRKIFARHGWPVIDVTRRSIEEASAAIIGLLHARQQREAARDAAP